MATNRWRVIQIAFGGVILILMLVIAAFALGVYVGEHGWTRQGLQYAAGPPPGGLPQNGQPPPEGQSQPGVQPPMPPPGLPPGPPDVVGRIRQISPQSLELATSGAPRAVLLSTATRIQDEQGRPLQIGDLKVGDVVAVFGRFVQGDGGQLQAEIIVRLPP